MSDLDAGRRSVVAGGLRELASCSQREGVYLTGRVNENDANALEDPAQRAPASSAAKTEPRTLPEKIWRCECGAEALGVSFYTWRDDPPEWFIEVYKLGGIGSWGWRVRNALNMLLGRDVYIEAVALDPPKVRELLTFLADCIAEVEGTQAVSWQVGDTIWTMTGGPYAA